MSFFSRRTLATLVVRHVAKVQGIRNSLERHVGMRRCRHRLVRPGNTDTRWSALALIAYAEWRATQNKNANPYVIEITCDFVRQLTVRRSSLTVKHFGTPNDSSRQVRSGMVLSSGATDAPRPRISLTRSIAVKTMTLEGMHSKIKHTFVTAVGQRGKWRTLWLGVTTRPGQL